MAESEEELRSFLMKVKEETGKAHLNLSIQKTKTIASGLITSWPSDGRKWTVTGIIFLGSKSLQMVNAAMKVKDTYFLEEKVWPTKTSY